VHEVKASRIFLLIFVVGLAAGNVFSQEFTLTTSATNVISSKASIGRPGLDGNPQAIIVATPLGDADKNNPHPIGAWYYKNKWNIFNTDHVVMPVNMRYKIEYWPEPDANHFLHVLTPQNIGDDGSYLDHPLLNGHPNAVFKILQNYAPDDDRAGYSLNANEAKAGYNAASGKWYIANINGKRLYPGTAYSVAIFSDGTESTTPTPATEPPQVTKPAPTRTREPITPASTPVAATATTSTTPANGTSACTKEMAWQTPGKWAKQRQDDLAMADRSFPKEQYKPVLAKAQKVIEMFKQASPEFNGIEAHAYRGIRGNSYLPNGPVPFRIDVGYASYICVGNDTASVDKRGKIILYGNYGRTTVQFNGLSDVLDTALQSGGFPTTEGEEIYEYRRDLPTFKGMAMIEPMERDGDRHEALIVAPNGRLPFKPVTREQFLLARIKFAEKHGGSFAAGQIAALNTALGAMSPTERRSPAIVRDINATPGRVKLFATEAEGGRHLVTIDRSYFDPRLPRDAIQLITVHWHWNDMDVPKVEAIKQFKGRFDFEALRQMLGR
jgi:hypothetical protein